MVDRSYVIRVGVDVGNVVSGMATASASVRSFTSGISTGVRGASRSVDATSGRFRNMAASVSSSMRSAQQSVSTFSSQSVSLLRNNEESAKRVGTAFLAVGAATLAGLGLAVKAAVDWESAWAGVTKTVDGSAEELAALEGELRTLAKTLPASHQEIAAVAEAAGQLGVQRDAVASFTRTMIDLGETTNLTADAAATAIAQLGNVMGTDLKNDVDNFGSALVALGNDGASTEAEILEMAQRISGAGATIGATEQEVLALASTLSSVGIAAEAGGSSVSRVMVDMASAVAGGGEELEAFAQVAGVTAEDFAASFETTPANAIDSFVNGLGRINESGGNVFQTLEDLSLSDIRVRDALLRMSNAGGLLADNIDLSNKAWAENTALLAEAEKRYDTTDAKIQIAKNSVNDAAISFGESLLPALGGVAEMLADVAGFFGDLPEPIQQFITAFAGVAGVAALVGGAFLVLGPRVIQAVDALRDLKTSAPGVSTALRRLGIASSIAAGIFLLSEASQALEEHFSPSVVSSIENMTSVLLKAADGSGELATELDTMFGAIEPGMFETDSIDNFGDALKRITDPSLGKRFNDFTDGIGTLWREGSRELEEVRGQFESLDQAMAHLVESGRIAEAEDGFAEIARLAKEEGVSVGELNELLPKYNEALGGTKAAAEAAATAGETNAASLDLQAAAAGVATEEFEAAQEAVQEMVEGWAESLASAVDPLGAWEAATRQAAESAAEAAGEGKDAWQDFADKAKVSLNDFIEELKGQVEAQQNWATNIALLAGHVTDDVLNEIVRWGPESAPLVQEMVDGIDDGLGELNTLIQQSMPENQQLIADELRKWGEVAGPIADEFGERTANRIAEGIATGKTTVEQALAELNASITEDVPGEITIEFDANTKQFQEKAGLTKESIAVIDALDALPFVDLNNLEFNKKNIEAINKMVELGKKRANPVADLNVGPFESAWGEALQKTIKLDGERPKPLADMEIAQLREAVARGNEMLNKMDKNDPSPEARLERERLNRDVARAEDILETVSRDRTANIAASTSGLTAVDAALNQVARDRNVTIRVDQYYGRIVGNIPERRDGGWIKGYASGGAVDFRSGGHNPYGRGSRIDDTLALVAKDEFVVNASAARRHRTLLEAINRGQIRGYANGGSVGGSPTIGNFAPEMSVRVFVGTREITDIVDVRIDDRNRGTKRRARQRTGSNR